jgi:DNA-binding SARP family transcriptional activator
VWELCNEIGNPWGAGLAALLHGLLTVLTEADGPSLAPAAAERFGQLGARALESVALAAGAVVTARSSAAGGDDVARAVAIADQAARAAGSDLARALVQLALVESEPARRDHRDGLEAIESVTGLRLKPTATGQWPATTEKPVSAGPVVHLQCFGRFSVTIDRHELDCSSVRPRARSALRLLAIHAGDTLHRDLMVDALWADQGFGSGHHSLHTAVSALRQLLEPGVGRGASSYVLRVGDGYQLALGPRCAVDVADFDRLRNEGRDAERDGDVDAAKDALGHALSLYQGELLPEEGAAEWVIEPRDRRRLEAAAVAQALGDLLLETDDAEAAVAVFESGLRADPYNDRLWRRFIATAEQVGDKMAAARAARDYQQVLSDLTVGRINPP